MIEFSKILKPHGINGQLKIQLFIDSYFDLSNLHSVFIDSNEHIVKSIKRINEEFALIKLDKILTMNDAELFRNKIIYIKKEDLPKLPSGRFYIEDLIGLTIITKEKEKLGIIKEIENTKTFDIIYCSGFETKRFCFPWIKKLDVVVDLNDKFFIIDKTVFDEIVIYDY